MTTRTLATLLRTPYVSYTRVLDLMRIRIPQDPYYILYVTTHCVVYANDSTARFAPDSEVTDQIGTYTRSIQRPIAIPYGPTCIYSRNVAEQGSFVSPPINAPFVGCDRLVGCK